LRDDSVIVDVIHFFDDTMWTDFLGGSEKAIFEAMTQMNDFRFIKMGSWISLTQHYTTKLHEQFVEKLLAWFQ